MVEKNKIYKDIDLSLKSDFRKDVRKKIGIEAINQHLKLLLLTEQDDIPFMNNVSADIRNILFQGNFSLHIENTLNELISTIIKQYEQRINLTYVESKFEGNSLTIKLFYSIKQDNIVGQFTTILKKTR